MKKTLVVVIIVGLLLFNFRTFLPINKLMKLKINKSTTKNVEINKNLSWEKDYQKALAKAKKENKDLALFFTKTTSLWCEKMQKELLENPEFIKKNFPYFIFCYVDFSSQIDSVSEKQKLFLQEKYKIKKFPTLLLLDEKERKIAKMGYLPLKAKQYAKKILSKTQKYHKLKKTSFQNLSAKELKAFYAIAKKLGSSYYVNKIYSIGIQKANTDFLLKEYQSKLKNNILSAMTIRKKIEESDPQNLHKIHLRLAMIDFHYLATQNVVALETIKPLIFYIRKFEKKDVENIWRLEMIIFHYLSLKEEKEKALDHARLAYKSAPPSIKREIAEAIICLKKTINK